MASNPPGEPLAALIPADAAGEPRELPIRSPVASIGQGPRNEIPIDDDSVSTTHARIEYSAGGWHVTDLDSRNGTYLEGVRLAPGVPTPLAEGAVIGIGAVRLRFQPRQDADLDRARAEYAPAAVDTPLAARGGFRLPVWLVLTIVLVLAAIVAVVVWLGGAPQPPAPADAPGAGLIAPEQMGSPAPGWLAA